MSDKISVLLSEEQVLTGILEAAKQINRDYI